MVRRWTGRWWARARVTDTEALFARERTASLMPIPVPSASYSIIVRCRIDNRPGMLGRLTTAVGAAGGDMGAIDIVRQDRDSKIRDLTINCRDDTHGQEIVAAMRSVT